MRWDNVLRKYAMILQELKTGDLSKKINPGNETIYAAGIIT